MIIGIYVSMENRYVGGGYVYQKSLFDAVVLKQSQIGLKHKIIFFYSGENELVNNLDGNFVNVDWYTGRLNEAAMRHKVDIMWFLSVGYEDVDMPHILPVWDLQHRIKTYFPEVSSGGEYISRENMYNCFLPRATYILTGTEEGKKEISFFYKIPLDRIVVNPLPSSPNISNEQTAITDELLSVGLNDQKFLFYPAQFWPHKNHIVLLEAMKILKSHGNLGLKLVFTGSNHGNMDYIIAKIHEMGLGNDVLLLGFVSNESILWLYQNAFALVYPSYFGPDNIPPIEAFSVGCSVIAANISGAKEQLGEAALFVDPQDEVGFAGAVIRLMEDQVLKNDLIQKGYAIAKTRTAENYVLKVFNIIDTFSSVRRCWGEHYNIKYTPKLLEWLNYYLQNKEIHSLISLLSICTDQSLETTYNNILVVFNRIVSSNNAAEAEIERKNFNCALDILNSILNECTDYAPAYINLSKICYANSDIEKAFEYMKTANYYQKRLRLCLY